MYDIKFNAKKSLGIKFGGQQVMSEVLYLGNSRIEWVSSVKHLGNYVNSDMTDKTDCDMKCSSFIGYVNKLKANFGYLQPFVLGNLFKTFCCSFYGSPLWRFISLSFKKICTTWNIGVRSIFNLPYRAHTYFLGPLLQKPHISEQLYIRSAQFLYNMYNSHNSIVQTCFINALYNSNSVIGLKIAYFRAKYRVNFFTSPRSTIMSSIRVTVPTENQTVSINTLFSLLSARSDLSFIEGFNLVEIIEMIDLCVNKLDFYIMFKSLYSSICLNFNFNRMFFLNLIEVFTTLNSNSVQYYFISLLYMIHYFYYDNLGN